MKTLLKTCGQVLRSWPFLLNLAVILLLTCWLPLLTQTMEMRDGAGNLVQQNTITSRVYESSEPSVPIARSVALAAVLPESTA